MHSSLQYTVAGSCSNVPEILVHGDFTFSKHKNIKEIWVDVRDEFFHTNIFFI